MDIHQKFRYLSLNKDVVIETTISMQNRHESGNLSIVWNMVWRIAGRWQSAGSIIGSGSYTGQGAI